MRLRIVFNGSIPKDDSPDAVNEDQTATDEARQLFAVSDGASESYDSARWARLIADAWLADGAVASRHVLDRLVREYEVGCDPASLSWSRQAAFDRGSFATLLGVSLRGSNLRIVAVGDSLAVGLGIDGGPLTFPYTAADEFDRRPLLLSTRSHANTALASRAAARGCVARWQLRPGSVLLLMTDALGQWLLRDGASESSCAILMNIRGQEELRDLVISRRDSGMMRRDDTTLLHLCAEES
jgi:hypothetical protein